MSDLLQLTKDNIDAESVDLDNLQALVTYLAAGFTFQNDFQILKFSDKSKLSKPQATRLRNEFTAIVRGKPKAYLRARLPIFVVGIVEYATEMLMGVSVATRVQTFKALLSGVDNGTLSVASFNLLRTMCTDSLAKPYYTRKLNSTLDPVSSFFDGRRPNSFSNALTECAELLASKSRAVQDRAEESKPTTPTITIVDDESVGRVLRLLPPSEEDDDSKLITVVDRIPQPTFEIIDNKPTDDLEYTPEVGEESKPRSEAEVLLASDIADLDESQFLDKYKYWMVGGLCGVALVSFVMLRK